MWDTLYEYTYFLYSTISGSQISWDGTWIYLLVVQYYIWKPDILWWYMKMFNSTIICWIPRELVIPPFLNQKKKFLNFLEWTVDLMLSDPPFTTFKFFDPARISFFIHWNIPLYCTLRSRKFKRVKLNLTFIFVVYKIV